MTLCNNPSQINQILLLPINNHRILINSSCKDLLVFATLLFNLLTNKFDYLCSATCLRVKILHKYSQQWQRNHFNLHSLNLLHLLFLLKLSAGHHNCNPNNRHIPNFHPHNSIESKTHPKMSNLVITNHNKNKSNN